MTKRSQILLSVFLIYRVIIEFSIQIPPDFYVSKYQEESKPISEKEFYDDDKDQDK